MFRNRSFLVRMVKDENEVTVDNGPPVDHTKLVDTITRNAIGVIVIYFGADTVRQVLVHVAKTAIQPD